MSEDIDNPLDDELLRELGLEPKAKPDAKPARPEPKPPSSRPPVAPPAKRPAAPPPSSEARENPSRETFEREVKNLAQDMPVQIVAVLGKRTLTLKDVISLKQGEILELKKLPQESIDLVANGKLLARGDLVLIDGKLGIQIKQLV